MTGTVYRCPGCRLVLEVQVRVLGVAHTRCGTRMARAGDGDEERKTPDPSIRRCADCGEEFTPASNRQRRCGKCSKAAQKAGDAERKRRQRARDGGEDSTPPRHALGVPRKPAPSKCPETAIFK